MIHDTQSAQTSQKEDGRNIYVTMKTMCPPDYHRQWLCGNSCSGAHDVRLHIAGTNESNYYAPCFACWALFGSLVPSNV